MAIKCSKGILIIAVILIFASLWNVAIVFMKNYLFLMTILAQKNKAVYDATNYSEIYSKIIFNVALHSMIWVLYIFSAISVIKLKRYGRTLMVYVSLVSLLGFVFIPLIEWQLFHRNLGIYFNPVCIIFLVNVWFFMKRSTKDQFKTLHNNTEKNKE